MPCVPRKEDLMWCRCNGKNEAQDPPSSLQIAGDQSPEKLGNLFKITQLVNAELSQEFKNSGLLDQSSFYHPLKLISDPIS